MIKYGLALWLKSDVRHPFQRPCWRTASFAWESFHSSHDMTKSMQNLAKWFDFHKQKTTCALAVTLKPWNPNPHFVWRPCQWRQDYDSNTLHDNLHWTFPDDPTITKCISTLRQLETGLHFGCSLVSQTTLITLRPDRFFMHLSCVIQLFQHNGTASSDTHMHERFLLSLKVEWSAIFKAL